MKESKTSAEDHMMSIGQFARKAGVTIRTVHYYEELGLFDHKPRLSYARRKYDSSDYYRLRLVMRAKLMGMPLADIKEVVDLLRQDPTETKSIKRCIELATLRLEKLDLQKREIENAYNLISGELKRLKDALLVREGLFKI